MNMKQVRVWSSGGGIRFAYTSTTATGNSYFEDILMAQDTYTTTFYGLRIDCNNAGNESACGFSEFHRLQLGGINYAGMAAVFINCSSVISFYDTDIESYQQGVYMYNCSQIRFYGGSILGYSVSCPMNFSGSTTDIDVYGTTMDGWYDYTDGTCILNWWGGYCQGGTTVQTASTTFHDVRNFKTEFASHTHSCINGTVIAHTLERTPTSITLTMYGENFINSTCWYLPPTLLSMNSTYFIICFTIFNAGTITGVASPDSRTIYWTAVYHA
jgi:hypothetical protein